jgi:predicted alpha-1,2-mannosidase
VQNQRVQLSAWPSRWLLLGASVLTASLLVPAAGAGSASATQVPLVTDPTGYVNPMIGTSGGGDVFPGASMPFGMVQWSPVETTGNQDASVGNAAEYTRSTSKIRGFSLTHLSGGGCPQEAGDIPIMPYVGDVSSSPSTDSTDAIYASAFSHAHEVAQPGYYSVRLNSGVGVQLSATKRTGSGRFSFPKGKPAAVLFRVSNSDAGSGDAYASVDPATDTVSGWVTSGGACGNGSDVSDRRVYYKLYFVAQFGRSFAAYGGWDNTTLDPGGTTASGGEGMTPQAGQGSGAYVTFNTARSSAVSVRVGISYVSAGNAQANLAAEDPSGTTLATVKARAHQAWQRELDLYHALLQPSLVSDVNGQYEGADSGNGQPGPVETVGPHQQAQYGTFSGWDQYRGQVQLVTLLNPGVGSDFAQSLLNFADQRGGDWDRWLDRNGSVSIEEGDPSPTAVAGIYAFGGDHFDLQAALDSLLTAATTPTAGDEGGSGCPVVCVGERPELSQYLSLHYVPSNNCLCWGSAGETLEDANADFSVAELARDAGDTGTYREFLQRAGYWRNVFDPDATGSGFTGYVAQREADGAWAPGFNDATWAGFAEGSSAQYTYMVFSDPTGLARLLGGDATTVKRLDAFFRDVDRRVATGAQPTLFDATNEPDLETPWTYDYVGAPSKTEATVRQVIETDWRDTDDGIPGGDDLGTLSSWDVWATLGLYPYVPSQANLVLTSPLFPRVVIHRSNGVTIIVNAPGASDGSPYVHGLTIDGAVSRQPWVPASLVTRGGVLDFSLSTSPDTSWGSEPADVPPSLSTAPTLTVTTTSVSSTAPDPVKITVAAHDAMSGLEGAPTCVLDGTTPLSLTEAGRSTTWSASVDAAGHHVLRCQVLDNDDVSASATATFSVS